MKKYIAIFQDLSDENNIIIKNLKEKEFQTFIVNTYLNEKGFKLENNELKVLHKEYSDNLITIYEINTKINLQKEFKKYVSKDIKNKLKNFYIDNKQKNDKIEKEKSEFWNQYFENLSASERIIEMYKQQGLERVKNYLKTLLLTKKETNEILKELQKNR
jgi:hypothetical protein